MELVSLVVPLWSSHAASSPPACGWQLPFQQGETIPQCFSPEGYRPRPSCPGGLSFPSGASQPPFSTVGILVWPAAEPHLKVLGAQ